MTHPATYLEAAHRLAPALGLTRRETETLAAIWEESDAGMPTTHSPGGYVIVSRLRGKLSAVGGGIQTLFDFSPYRYVLRGTATLMLRAQDARPRAPFEWRLSEARPPKTARTPFGPFGQEEILALQFCAAPAEHWLSEADLTAALVAEGSLATGRGNIHVLLCNLRRKLEAHAGIQIERRRDKAWRITAPTRDMIPPDLLAPAPGLGR